MIDKRFRIWTHASRIFRWGLPAGHAGSHSRGEQDYSEPQLLSLDHQYIKKQWAIINRRTSLRARQEAQNTTNRTVNIFHSISQFFFSKIDTAFSCSSGFECTSNVAISSNGLRTPISRPSSVPSAISIVGNYLAIAQSYSATRKIMYRLPLPSPLAESCS